MTPAPAILERTRYGHLPRNPPTPREREIAWRIKWAGLTIEQTLGLDFPDVTDPNEPDYQQ